MRSFEKLTSYIPLRRSESGSKNIGLLVDGPNMLRKEFRLNLDLVREIIAEYGNMRVGKVLLNQYASDKLIEAIVNQGFTPLSWQEIPMFTWLLRPWNLFTILTLML